MPTLLYQAILPYSGKAVRFEKPGTQMAMAITEAAEAAVGKDSGRAKMMNALQRETALVSLRQITARPVPLVMKSVPYEGAAGKPVVDAEGKPAMREVVDEAATLKAIESDEDALAKGCPWISLGHLDMITESSPNALFKLFPDGDEFVELFLMIERAGAKPRLPLSGKATMVVTAT